MQQEQEEMRSVDIMGMTARKAKKAVAEMLNAIGNSDAVEDGDDEDDDYQDSEPGKLSEDDEPGAVMGTIFAMVLHHMERFPQK